MKAKSGNGADAAGAGVVANGVDATPDPKRTPGRPKGSPKVAGSGRRKGVPNAMGREARVYLAAESGYLDVIARVCKGLPIRLAGPTGKRRWHYPDWPDLRWAVELVSSKCIPTMSAAEVSGPDGEPLNPPPLPDREIARRLAWLLTKPGSGGEGVVAELTEGTEGSATASTPGTPPAGRSGGEGVGGGSATSSPSRGNGADDSPEATGGGPLSDRGGSGSHEDPVFSPENFSENPQSKKPAPVPPKEGEDAYVGQFVVKVREASRTGLPLNYSIYSVNGQLLSGACSGWAGALKWIRHRSTSDADLVWTVRLPLRGDGISPAIRPDQYETRLPAR